MYTRMPPLSTGMLISVRVNDDDADHVNDDDADDCIFDDTLCEILGHPGLQLLSTLILLGSLSEIQEFSLS